MVAMDYAVLIESLLLLFFAVVFFFNKSRFAHIASGLGIIFMAFILDFPPLALGVVALSVFAISYFFLTSRVKSRMFTFIILLVVLPVVFAAPGNDSPSIDNTPKPPGIIKFIEEVGSVKHQPKMELMGTDYLPGDEGKLLSFITIGEYPVQNANCYVSVLYPDMSYFLMDYLMNPINKTYFVGGHYLDFTVPNITGIYPVNSYCFFNSSALRDNPTYLDSDIEIDFGSIADLEQFDGGEYMQFKGSGECKNVNCSITLTTLLPVGFFDEFLFDFRTDVMLWTDKDRIFYFWVYDYVAMEKHVLFNFTKNLPLMPTSYQNVLNESVVSPNSTVVVGIDVYNFDGGKLQLYYSHFDRVYNGSYVQDLRGAGELVVSKSLYNVTLAVNQDIEFVDSGTAVLILLLVLSLFLLFIRQEAFSGLVLGLWTLLYSANLYITIVLLLLSVVLIWWGVSRKK